MNSEIESSGIAEQEILKVDEKESTKEETNVTNKNQNLQNEQKEVEELKVKKNQIQSDFVKILVDFQNIYEKMANKTYNFTSQHHQSRENQENSQLLNDTNEFLQQKKCIEFQLGGQNEKLKAAEAKIQEQVAEIEQLKTELQEKEKKNLMMTQQYYSIFHNQALQVSLQIQEYEQQINELSEEKQYLERKYKSEKIKNQNSADEIFKLENQLSAALNENKQLEYNIRKYQRQIDEIKKEQEHLERDYNNFQRQHKILVQQAQSTLQNTQKKHEDEVNSLNNKINQLNTDITNLKNQASKLTTQVQVEERKIERVLENFGETKLFEKITGPLEKIMASKYKINRFIDDPNSQSDNAQYKLIEITLQFDKYTQYVKEGKFFLIDECFKYGNKINITATRSIKANAESEFYQGYLIKIIESAQADLKTKTLLRKDLKQQNLAFQNKEEAARLAVNNIFCQWLQMQFNKDFTIAKLKPQKQTIQRQFIIENEAKKEYYYCEMVEEGPYSKINGGKFVPQKDEIHQYFNALSLYSYKMFEQQLILTNLQVCGNYVYDMIVHTNHKGLFSPLDQGSHESLTFTEILSKQPADIMSKSWNETVKSQAEKYLRQ